MAKQYLSERLAGVGALETGSQAPGAVQLGLGLIGIGRPWGYKTSGVPEESAAVNLLEFAFELGIRFYDTAPSYGLSEQRLGRFLSSLTREQLAEVTVATKFGDHWNDETQSSFVDHSYEALMRSLDSSLQLLPKIDILQLHRPTPEALVSSGLEHAWEVAIRQGIREIGVSVSDIACGEIVCSRAAYTVVQVPFHKTNSKLSSIIRMATDRGMTVIINRPFDMGKLLYVGEALIPNDEARVAALAHILGTGFQGVILTGTTSREHLQENVQAFKVAIASEGGR